MSEELARYFSTEQEWAMWEAYKRYYRAKYYGEKPGQDNRGDSTNESNRAEIQRDLAS